MRTSATVLGLIIFFASATISGRATLTVTYHSDPQGATLYEYETLLSRFDWLTTPGGIAWLATPSGIAWRDQNQAKLANENETKPANEKPFGYTPMTLRYERTEAFNKKRGCMALRPVKVRWASDAEAAVQTMEACPQNGNNQQFTFIRPTGLPGREIDVQIAIELQRNAILARQADQADQTARLAMWQQYADRFRAAMPIIPRPVRCTSTLILNTIYTTCQ